MTIRVPLVLAALGAALFVVPADVLCADTASAAKRDKERADNDVRVRLKVRGKRNGRLRIDVKVKNRGRLDQDDLQIVLHDGDAGSPLWSDVISLDSGKRKKFRLRFERDEVGAELTAECRGPHDDDEHPDDNTDTEPTVPGNPSEPSAAERGRDIYVPQCSGCHGDDGRGGTVDENIAKESWDEFVEAFREGEDGMPTYPDLNSRDARDIVAYLRNPGAVAPPTTPPTTPPPADPPPTDTTPTYTSHVKSILDARCVACHGSGFAAAGIALHTYAAASQNATTSLASIVAGRMPTSAPLPTAEVDTIRAWIDGGKPQ